MHCLTKAVGQRLSRIGSRLVGPHLGGFGVKVLKVFLFFAWFSGIAHNASAVGAQEQCVQARIDPEIKFDVQNADIELNRSKSSAQIQRFAKKVNAFRPVKGHSLLGLAFVAMQHQISVEVLTNKIGNRYCVRLKKVHLLFGREKSTIFVASKYRAGTCEFKAILAHENEHMAINARVQLKYEEKIKKALENSAKAIQPFITTSRQAAPRTLAARFASDIKPILNSFHEERVAENLHIDTPQSYQKTRSLCANW